MYLPSSPRYARIPESTLTPAPVKSAARPGRARKEHSCSIAAAFGVAAEETGWWWGRVGIEIRTMIADQEESRVVVGWCQVVSGGDLPFGLRLRRNGSQLPTNVPNTPVAQLVVSQASPLNSTPFNRGTGTLDS